jgi:hypothetical protein
MFLFFGLTDAKGIERFNYQDRFKLTIATDHLTPELTEELNEFRKKNT